MAIVYVKELWEGRRAHDDINKRTTLVHVYEVRTDSNDDDATVAGGTNLLPRLGDPHPNYPDAFVTDVDPVNHSADPTLWTVTITYGTDLPSVTGGSSANGGGSLGGAGGPGAEAIGMDPATGEPVDTHAYFNRPELPTDQPPAWTTDTVEDEEVFEFAFDVDGELTPVLNSAGLPPDPPLMTVRRRLMIGLNKNTTGITYPIVAAYIDKLNESEWMGFDAKTVRIVTFRMQSAVDKIAYQQCFLQFKVKTEGWQRKVIDRGFYVSVETSPGTFDWERIRDPDTGERVSEPQLLDGAGSVLAFGEDPIKYPTEGYTEFTTADFDTLMTLLGIS